MKLTPVLLAATAAPATLVSALDLRLITYNIRIATGSPGKNEMRWSDRRPLLTQQLKHESKSNSNTLMCFQEVYDHVVDDIQDDLGSSWSHTGKGRDDGDRKGEFSPIFYRNDAWTLDASNTYWLSKTPDKPSKGWDAGHKRIVTVAELSHKESGEEVVYMCTHFDWKGKKAQRHSAELILDWVDGYTDKPVFVAGDLNLEPGEKPYNTLVTKLTDLRSLSGGEDAEVLTYTGFSDKGDDDMLIDFIFVNDKNRVVDPTYTVPSNIKDDEYISDHRPVIVDLEIGLPEYEDEFSSDYQETLWI